MKKSILISIFVSIIFICNAQKVIENTKTTLFLLISGQHGVVHADLECKKLNL